MGRIAIRGTESRKKLGRNDECPTCFKKIKRCGGRHGIGFALTKSKKWFYAFLVTGLISLVIAISLSYIEAQKESRITAFRNEFVSLFQNLPDTWWFKTSDFGDGTDRAQAADDIRARLNAIHRTLDRYKGLNKLAGKIHDTFNDIYVSVYNHGATISISATDALLPTGLEICFVPQDQAEIDPEATLWYHQEWHAVLIYGISWPQTVFDALLLHEMGHAYRDIVEHTPSARAEAMSDLWIEEEIEMHELESEILNAGTNGAYFRLVDQIITKNEQTETAEEAVISLKKDDFETLNRVVSCDPCTQRVATVLEPQHLFTVAIRFLETKQQSDLAHKVAFYRFMRAKILDHSEN